MKSCEKPRFGRINGYPKGKPVTGIKKYIRYCPCINSISRDVLHGFLAQYRKKCNSEKAAVYFD